MSSESIGFLSICSATDWWLEVRCVHDGKLLRRLPIAAWALTRDEIFMAICYDGDARRVFYTSIVEDEDGLEYSFRHGINLKQIGIGIPFGDETPKRIRKKGKK
jgi:hypothetical protein